MHALLIVIRSAAARVNWTLFHLLPTARFRRRRDDPITNCNGARSCVHAAERMTPSADLLGVPPEKALFEDAPTLFDAVHAKHADVDVVGRSLGSGIAVYVASVRPVARLVLVTPFDSLRDLAAAQFPYVPVKWLMLDKFESWKYAPHVSAPTRIIAAEHDEIVPRASSDLLRSGKCYSSKRLFSSLSSGLNGTRST